MQLSEILTESRQAPLFHATSLEAALAILAGNKIAGTTGQRLDARRGKRYKMRNDDWHGAVYGYKMKGGRDAKGVSLTRDYNFANSWQRSDVIFVLDQAKLAQTTEIVPIDHVNNGSYDYAAIGFKHMEQAEEFVIGDIAPLSRCLLSINVSLSQIDRVELEQFINQRVLWGNPLLNRWYPRNWRAQYDRGHYEAEYDNASYLNRLYRQMRKQGKTVAEIIAHMREMASQAIEKD
jgi:hypothetical protein